MSYQLMPNNRHQDPCPLESLDSGPKYENFHICHLFNGLRVAHFSGKFTLVQRMRKGTGAAPENRRMALFPIVLSQLLADALHRRCGEING